MNEVGKLLGTQKESINELSQSRVALYDAVGVALNYALETLDDIDIHAQQSVLSMEKNASNLHTLNEHVRAMTDGIGNGKLYISN
jgi:hypothetical protein